jgi:maltose/moltooligosaccharide transporter
LGRRKPYFFTDALLSSAALVFFPNSGSLAGVIPALWVGAQMVMIMDASFNVAMEPFRALVAANLPDRQRTLGFSMQTFLIGLVIRVAQVGMETKVLPIKQVGIYRNKIFPIFK